MADAFDRVAEWLQRACLLDVGFEELVAGLGKRLIECGVPVARISQGRILMHPVIGAMDVTWNAETNRTDQSVYGREDLLGPLEEASPFSELNRAVQITAKSLSHLRELEMADTISDLPFLHDDLTDPAIRAKFPIYGRLAAAGMTDYFALIAPFGMRAVSLVIEEPQYLGATVSYATRRRSGFTDREIEGFRRISMPLMAALRVVSDRFFTTELIEAYLGRIPGQSVLSGQISRGEIQRINCALFYSDMRQSTELSQQLSPEDYVAAVNRYFDCVGGAVLQHGGEVLKFVGDGVLAIFPIDGKRRTSDDMCAAALSAAKEAFQRREALAPGEAVDFGIGLHIGEVAFGNVGTAKRLDFTVIASSVAKVSRVEALTRTLGVPLLTTGAFVAEVSEPSRLLGSHHLRDFEEEIEIGIFDLSD